MKLLTGTLFQGTSDLREFLHHLVSHNSIQFQGYNWYNPDCLIFSQWWGNACRTHVFFPQGLFLLKWLGLKTSYPLTEWLGHIRSLHIKNAANWVPIPYFRTYTYWILWYALYSVCSWLNICCWLVETPMIWNPNDIPLILTVLLLESHLIPFNPNVVGWFTNLQCGAPKIAKLVYNYNN